MIGANAQMNDVLFELLSRAILLMIIIDIVDCHVKLLNMQGKLWFKNPRRYKQKVFLKK